MTGTLTRAQPLRAAPAARRVARWQVLARRARRALGALLVAFVALPLYRLIAHEDTGLAGAWTAEWAETQWTLITSGMLLLLAAGLLAARLLPPAWVEGAQPRVRGWLLRPSPAVFAGALALWTFAATAAFCLIVLEGRPSLIDAMVQLLHARFWAEGRLAGPLDAVEFWHIQNAVITSRGWVSQYPPGHVLLLALGLRAGAVWAVGPLMAAVTVYFAARTAELWLPAQRAAARFGALLLAVSPFFVALAGAYMNHVTAAAFLAVAAYGAARAVSAATPGWPVLAGAAAGFAFATRPLAALAIGTAVVVGVWLVRLDARRCARNVLLAALGAAPFVAALALYNLHFFGSPTTFGYDVALGPSIGLGFHRDPWGNMYGVAEAVGYTASDLLALSVAWLETPLPLVALVGVYLLLAPKLPAGARVALAAALLPVAANFFYWHHGIYMGPRMLHEAAPWWLLLGALASSALIRALPLRAPGRFARFSPRAGMLGLLAAGLAVGLLFLTPQRVLSYGGLERSPIELPLSPAPAIVFVHDAWISRLNMDLAASGVRLGDVETLARQNYTCRVWEYARARQSGLRPDPATFGLDLVPRATSLPPTTQIAPGSEARFEAGALLTASCEEQVRADRFGTYDIASFVWQGDLPGGPARRVLFVRDLGPARNATALAAFADRTPYVFTPVEKGGRPVLLPYDDGMRLLWGSPAPPATSRD